MAQFRQCALALLMEVTWVPSHQRLKDTAKHHLKPSFQNSRI